MASIHQMITAALDRASGLLGERVVYRRGDTEWALTAVVGNTPFRTDADRGATMFLRSVDFLIAAADLPLTPAEGDTITRVIGDRSDVHEVTRFNDAPPWRWRDAGQTHIRVHTRFIRHD